MRRLVAALAVPLLAGCHLRAHAPPALSALSDEGEIRVYLQPLPEDAPRLAFSVAAVLASRADGGEEALEVALPEISGAAAPGQRLLARGRLPPGSYSGLALRIPRATIASDGRAADLLVPEEPVRVDVPFKVERNRAVLVRLTLRNGQALAQEFRFDGAFLGDATGPENSAIQLAAYCSTPSLASLTVVDRRAHAVSGVLPTGRQPLGVALDARTLRGYVALAGDDQIQVLDLVTGEELRRIPLRAGDEPREVGLTPDGALLVTVNPGSTSASFVDTESGTVLATVSTGDEPSALLLDRGGRRGYVLNRRSRSITVLDLANFAVVQTVPTDPEPLRAALSRDGTRLYLVARGSAHLTVFSVPDMAVVRTVFLGLGAAAITVDPRSDLVYVGRADEARIQVFDPISALPVDAIEVPGPVSHLAMDQVENALVAVLSTGQVAFVDVARKRLVATVDVGAGAYQVAVMGERP
jgi:DNA-binding beta-propeller fold protein YncE